MSADSAAVGSARAGGRGLPRRRRARVAPLRELEVLVLRLAALVFADRDAVELDGAPDEVAVADEPRVLAILAPHPGVAGTAKLGHLALVEDVLLKLFPVVVAACDDLLHERVEVVLSRNG